MASPQQSPLLSIIIPAFNEQSRIKKSLEKICSFLGFLGQSYEVIVVNDGSRDSTGEKVRAFLKEHPEVRLVEYQENMGKGYAVRLGVMCSRGQFVVFSDADLATPIEEARPFMDLLQNGYGVVMASRTMAGSQIVGWRPWHRLLSGKLFNLMVRLLAVPKLTDTQCGFKGFTRESARKIFSNSQIDGFAFDVEILYLALKYGYRIKEVPVRWQNSPQSKVNIFRHTFPMLEELLQVKLNDLRNRYEPP